MAAKARHAVPFPSFRAFADACAKNNLRVYLAIITTPDSTHCEPLLPAVPIYNPFTTAHDPNRQPDATERRKLEFLLRVYDGETVCCSGDLGESIRGEQATANMLRMAAVLINQRRIQASDFPSVRP